MLSLGVVYSGNKYPFLVAQTIIPNLLKISKYGECMWCSH